MLGSLRTSHAETAHSDYIFTLAGMAGMTDITPRSDHDVDEPTDPDVIRVLNRTSHIENLLNQVIEKFCAPRKDVIPFFWNVVLHSSIMQLGAKIKLANAIAQELGTSVNGDPIHKLIAARNAFAHSEINSHPILTVHPEPGNDTVHYTLHVISNSGKSRWKPREEVLREFDECFELASQSLVKLRDSVLERLSAEL